MSERILCLLTFPDKFLQFSGLEFGGSLLSSLIDQNPSIGIQTGINTQRPRSGDQQLSTIPRKAPVRLGTKGPNLSRVSAGQQSRMGVTPLAGAAKFSVALRLSGSPPLPHTFCTRPETKHRRIRNMTVWAG